ncbi:hypothetical protein WNY59_15035 [Ahrensia kielensis]|uniref:Transporter n=1 Tax=Ahrensia kielensis TaxID=76980 RepID=A0ABU9T9V7_9HYPH
MMISLDYAFYHIERVLRMMRGDASALDEMDISTDGFWRSFGTIIFALPALFFMWVESSQELISQGSDLQMGQIFIRRIPIDIISWVLPFAFYPIVLKFLNRPHRYSHLVIAINWSNLVLYYVFAAIILISFFLPKTEAITVTLGFLMIATLIASIVVVTHVIKISLNASAGLAAAFVIVEIIVLYTLVYNVEGLLGLHVPAPL